MNIHPIFVHFPIAFLMVYALFETVTVKCPKKARTLKHIKTFLLWVGTIGAFFALQTGEMAEELVGRSQLLSMHSAWANATTIIFSALSVVYLFAVFGEFIPVVPTKFPQLRGMVNVLVKVLPYAMRLYDSVFVVLLAIIGFVAITVTGALGGALVYGVDADPVVHFIYQLLFPH